MRTAQFNYLPDPYPNEPGTPDDRLKSKAMAGLKERLAFFKQPGPLFASEAKEYKKRLNFELKAIKEAGFANYLLIAADFVDYARKHGILIGPGCNSAPGCLVNYALGITKIDPIAYGLIFERFFTVGQDRLPAIDFDCCVERRREIHRYLMAKYGAPHFKQFIRGSNGYAFGIVLSNHPIAEIYPLYSAQGTDEVCNAIADEEGARKIGMALYVLLGLRHLDGIGQCLKLVKESGRGEIVIDSIPLDDRKTWELLAAADTYGVFMSAAQGMRDLLKQIQPQTIEQLAAVYTLYWPDPIEKGIPETYIRRKGGQEAIPAIHPVFDEITQETFGLILFQEQVMMIVHAMAGIPLDEAHGFFKRILQNDPEAEALFLYGCSRKRMGNEPSGKVFSELDRLDRHASIKADDLCYALLTYQTAWLKANFPGEFARAFPATA